MDKTWRTKAHQNYQTPTLTEIAKFAQSKGSQDSIKLSLTLIQDICNVLSFQYFGGLLTDAMLDLNRVNYLAMVSTKPLAKREKLAETQKRADAKIQDFLKTFNFDQITGKSPLERALNVVIALSKIKAESGETDGEALPIFCDSETESASDALQEMLDKVKDFSDETTKILDFNKNSTEAINNLPDEAFLIADISRKLKKLAKFKTQKGTTFVTDPKAKTSKRQTMRSFDQITKVNPKVYFGMPKDFLAYKMATKSITVKEKGEYKTSKQLLYLLIDKSGSMCADNRITTAKAIILNRLEAVSKGDAILFIRFFDNGLSQEFKIETAQEAKDFYQKVTRNEFNGGSTDIDIAIKRTVRQIDEMQKNANFIKPEICIVTDGDDLVLTKYEDLRGNVLHAFLVGEGCQNEQLLKLANASNGVALNI